MTNRVVQGRATDVSLVVGLVRSGRHDPHLKILAHLEVAHRWSALATECFERLVLLAEGCLIQRWEHHALARSLG